MHKVLESFIRQRRITIFAIVLVMILGVMNYINAPKQQSPRIQLATALITTIYPGGSAEDVERLVTREIEEKLMALDECDEVSSYSNPNHSVVFYSVKVSDDYSEQWSTLRRAMKEVQSDLPEACNSITVDTDFMKTVGFILSIYSEGGMINTLESYGDSFENELEKVPGISRVDVIGKRDQEVIVELNHQKLNQLAIGYNDIVSIIRAQNIEIPSGHVEVGNEQIVFQVQGLYNQVEDIGNIVVAVSDETGIMTRLKDIATIYIENKAEGTRILNNQRQSLLITGYFENGQNIIPIGQEINDIIDDISTRLPSNMVIEKIMFQPDQVNSEISKFMMSLLQGIVLVIIVVFIGLGIRNAFVVAVAIPLSILVTMTLMGLWLIEIQQISITALIIALGMLVDNAIVVSDAIQVRIDNGQKRLDACIEGALEVSRPVLTSTLTTICTFMPILLLGGEMGEYLRSMPIIVMLSLTASYFVAIFVTPVLAFIAFKPSINKRERKHRLVHLLEYAMRHRLRVILIVISLFIFSLFSVQWIGLKFFPYADTDMLYVDVNTEHVVSIDETEVLAKEVSRVLMETKGVKKIVSSVGDGMPRFFDTMFPSFPAIDYSQMLLIVDKEMIGPNKPYSSLTDLRDVLQNTLNKSVIAGHLEVMQLEQGEPVGAPINVKVVGDGRDQLKEAGEYVEGLLKDIPGTTHVSSDYSAQQITYSMFVNRFKASQRGLNNYDIQNAVSILLRGRTAGMLRLKDADYNIKVKSDIEVLSELSNAMIKSPLTEKKYYLRDLGEITLDGAQTQIRKHDGDFIVNVNANVLSGYSAVEIQQQLARRIDEQEYPELRFEYKGESDSIERNFGNVAASGIAFIAIIYGILLLQFKSFLRPLLILVTIPLSIIGALFGLLITGISLSFTAFLGMVSLAGIVVNNAIVLVDYIDEESKRGMRIHEACLQAAQKRTRPILLSTITTAVGLIPLILSDNELFTPMAVTLMSGLVVSTALTLVVVPVLVSLITVKEKEALVTVIQ